MALQPQKASFFRKEMRESGVNLSTLLSEIQKARTFYEKSGNNTQTEDLSRLEDEILSQHPELNQQQPEQTAPADAAPDAPEGSDSGNAQEQLNVAEDVLNNPAAEKSIDETEADIETEEKAEEERVEQERAESEQEQTQTNETPEEHKNKEERRREALSKFNNSEEMTGEETGLVIDFLASDRVSDEKVAQNAEKIASLLKNRIKESGMSLEQSAAEGIALVDRLTNIMAPTGSAPMSGQEPNDYGFEAAEADYRKQNLKAIQNNKDVQKLAEFETLLDKGTKEEKKAKLESLQGGSKSAVELKTEVDKALHSADPKQMDTLIAKLDGQRKNKDGKVVSEDMNFLYENAKKFKESFVTEHDNTKFLEEQKSARETKEKAYDAMFSRLDKMENASGMKLGFKQKIQNKVMETRLKLDMKLKNPEKAAKQMEKSMALWTKDAETPWRVSTAPKKVGYMLQKGWKIVTRRHPTALARRLARSQNITENKDAMAKVSASISVLNGRLNGAEILTKSQERGFRHLVNIQSRIKEKYEAKNTKYEDKLSKRMEKIEAKRIEPKSSKKMDAFLDRIEKASSNKIEQYKENLEHNPLYKIIQKLPEEKRKNLLDANFNPEKHFGKEKMIEALLAAKGYSAEKIEEIKSEILPKKMEKKTEQKQTPAPEQQEQKKPEQEQVKEPEVKEADKKSEKEPIIIGRENRQMGSYLNNYLKDKDPEMKESYQSAKVCFNDEGKSADLVTKNKDGQNREPTKEEIKAFVGHLRGNGIDYISIDGNWSTETKKALLDACGDKIQVANREEIEQAYQTEQAAKQTPTNEETKTPEPKTETKEEGVKRADPKTETKETPQPTAAPKTETKEMVSGFRVTDKDIAKADKLNSQLTLEDQKRLDKMQSVGNTKNEEEYKRELEKNFPEKNSDRRYVEALHNRAKKMDGIAQIMKDLPENNPQRKALQQEYDKTAGRSFHSYQAKKKAMIKARQPKPAAKGKTVDLSAQFVKAAQRSAGKGA